MAQMLGDLERLANYWQEALARSGQKPRSGVKAGTQHVLMPEGLASGGHPR
jgi:hypothetical protein